MTRATFVDPGPILRATLDARLGRLSIRFAESPTVGHRMLLAAARVCWKSLFWLDRGALWVRNPSVGPPDH
jgi:hypothetical protein